MLKRPITYTNFNDETVTEDFYFNLTKAELIELELSAGEDGLAESLRKLVKERDGQQIVDQFKRIILLAYGEKSPDGRRFVKSEQLRQEFASTEAYSELFVELATSADAAAKFIRAIVPQNLNVEEASLAAVAQLPSTEANAPESLPSTPADETPKNPKDMTREELLAAFVNKTQSTEG